MFWFFGLIPLAWISSSHHKKINCLRFSFFLLDLQNKVKTTRFPQLLFKSPTAPFFPLLDVKTEKKKRSQWVSTCCFTLTASELMIFLDKQTTEWVSPSFLQFCIWFSARIIRMKMSRVKRSYERRVGGFNCSIEFRSKPLWKCINTMLYLLPYFGQILVV